MFMMFHRILLQPQSSAAQMTLEHATVKGKLGQEEKDARLLSIRKVRGNLMNRDIILDRSVRWFKIGTQYYLPSRIGCPAGTRIE